MGDIARKCDYPLKALSNFAGDRFYIDGIECNSREGFLQALKFKPIDQQKRVCQLVGFGAKKAGYGKNWHKKQVLYWQGKAIGRHSKEYQDLLDKMFQAVYDQCPDFVKALNLTSGQLTHSIGKTNPSETVLTRSELCSRLMKLRAGERLFQETSL